MPGAWHEPEIYDQVSQKLRDDGYQTDYVYLPGISSSDIIEDFTPDVQEIRKHVLTAIEAGQKVIVFSHSYSGVPASDAVYDLGWKQRQAAGQPGGVTHFFSCNGMVIPVGSTVLDFAGGSPPPFWDVSEDEKTVFPKDPEVILYPGLSEESQKKWIARLRRQSYGTCKSVTKHAAWEIIPSTFVYSSQETVFVPEMQREMIRKIGEKYFRTEVVDSGHFTMFLQKPDEIVAAVKRAAEIEV